MALVSIPGGIANGLLAGVNPIYGVYSMIAGTTVGAFFTSSVVMNVDSTGAPALATFDALGDVAPEDQLGQLVMLSLLVGVFMLVLGFLRLAFLGAVHLQLGDGRVSQRAGCAHHSRSGR
jgi:SulP family sulfate permease